MHQHCIHVEPLPQERRGEWLAVRASVSGHPRRRRRNGIITFELPEPLADCTPVRGAIDDRHDIWLRSVIFSAMEAGRDLMIHGNVSTSLLANLEVYQSIISDWWPKYRVVKVSADREVAAPPAPTASEAVLTFSGGLDSIHALYSHQHHLRGRNSRQIPLCVFVHGFDIPLQNTAYRGAYQRAQRIVESLGSQLVAVRTNLRQLLPPWPECYATALAAALSLFSGRFTEGLIASSVNYRNDHLHEAGYGSSPTSDWLLSAHDFRITHDLANATRVDKTRVLCDCETARTQLRVCWAGDDLSTNCGTCPKCLWQMLCMRAVGLTDFRAFQQPLTTQRVAHMSISSPVHWEDLRTCCEYARATGLGQLAEFAELRRVLEHSPFGAGRSVAPPAPAVGPRHGGHMRQTIRRLAHRLRSWRTPFARR